VSEKGSKPRTVEEGERKGRGAREDVLLASQRFASAGNSGRDHELHRAFRKNRLGRGITSYNKIFKKEVRKEGVERN